MLTVEIQTVPQALKRAPIHNSIILLAVATAVLLADVVEMKILPRALNRAFIYTSIVLLAVAGATVVMLAVGTAKYF